VLRDEVAEAIEPPTSADGFAAELVRELPYLVRLAARLVRDPDQAEDCAQETIVGAWRRQDQLRDPAALSAWLRRSLVNRIIDRSRAHHDELDIDAVEADWRDDRYSVAPDRVLERAELRDALEGCFVVGVGEYKWIHGQRVRSGSSRLDGTAIVARA